MPESPDVERHVAIAPVQLALDIGHEVPHADGMTLLARALRRASDAVQRSDGFGELRAPASDGGVGNVAAEQREAAAARDERIATPERFSTAFAVTCK